jgi:hypothetical protein
MTSDPVLQLLERVDPAREPAVAAWDDTAVRAEVAARAAAAPAATSLAAVVPLRRTAARTRRLAAAGALVLAGGTGVAAAGGVLGSPAPPSVLDDLAAVDRGMPADLRLNPDLSGARAVAATASAVLYAADLPDGGHCSEIVVGGGRPSGAVCTRASALGARPVEVTAPIAAPGAPLVLGGRLNEPGLDGLHARFADGSTAEVAIGDAGFWLYEVPTDHHRSVLDGGLTLVATRGGQPAGEPVTVPPLRDEEDGGALDVLQPIFVSTVSDDADLTSVLAVEGKVHAEGAASLELLYPDGTVEPVALGADGSYRHDLALDRRDDLAATPGLLVARDASGTTVASAPVASVAWWRTQGG